jgi:hypothetical protein
MVVAYCGTEPVRAVTINAVDATGRDLPMPQAGLIEQAVRLVTRQPPPTTTIPDAFATAAADRLEQLHVQIATAGNTAAQRLEINLTRWDLRDDGASGAVAFVSATYQLLDAHGSILWAVEQDRLPARFSGPNLSRYEVARIARTCVGAALASLPTPAAPRGSSR